MRNEVGGTGSEGAKKRSGWEGEEEGGGREDGRAGKQGPGPGARMPGDGRRYTSIWMPSEIPAQQRRETLRRAEAVEVLI